MSAPIEHDKLTAWAREHLVYETGMLVHATHRVGELMHAPRGPESNTAVECFAVHVRCLDGFLWDKRGGHKLDAFASDFCDRGVWARDGVKRPSVLVSVHERERLGREIVHLSYCRLHVSAEMKDWPVGEISGEILRALGRLTDLALPERMDDDTRAALRDSSVVPPAVMTTTSSTHSEESYRGGTIGFPTPGSVDGSE